MKDKVIQFRCPSYLIEKIEAFAAQNGMNKSEALRNLVSIQLEAEETVVTANSYIQILKDMGYDRISDIPEEGLDEAVKAFIAAGKTE